ncbi:MAG: flavin reductase family protein [Woeseia sp.]
MNAGLTRIIDTKSPVAGEVDQRDFRDAMSRFATGVAIVTTVDEQNGPVGVTISSVTSLSLDPPLVLWSIGLGAYSLPAFRRAGEFALNFLPADKWELCEQFARPATDKFRHVTWHRNSRGVPLLDGMLAHVSCTTWRRYPGGDHEIFVGRVRSVRMFPGEPLVIFGGERGRQLPPEVQRADCCSRSDA